MEIDLSIPDNDVIEMANLIKASLNYDAMGYDKGLV